MKRGQIQILTEFLGFSVGIIVVISITYIFSQYLAPLVIDEAMSFHLKNLLKQVQTASSSIIYYSEIFQDKNITLRLALPLRINRYSYEIYRANQNLCAAVSGTKYAECENNTYDIKGLFVSGSRMNLEARLEADKRTVYMSSA